MKVGTHVWSKVSVTACAAAWAALLASGSGCARTSQFQKDQSVTQDPPSYYSKNPASAGKTPTDRIAAMGQPKKRVIVFDFWNNTPVHLGREKDNELGKFAADELRRGLHQTQRVILPTDVKTELTTADFVQSGNEKVRVAQLIREGRRLGVAVAIIGQISRSVFRTRGDEVGLFRQRQSMSGVDVEIKVFDVQAGREIAALGRSGEASSNAVVAIEGDQLESPEARGELAKLASRNAMVGLVPEAIKTVEKMNWEGSIAKLAGSKIYINAGKNSGIVVGDILKVMAAGDDVYDPASGAFLGRTPGLLKGTIEVVDYLGTDGTVGDVHSGGNFQVGDSVHLY